MFSSMQFLRSANGITILFALSRSTFDAVCVHCTCVLDTVAISRRIFYRRTLQVKFNLWRKIFYSMTAPRSHCIYNETQISVLVFASRSTEVTIIIPAFRKQPDSSGNKIFVCISSQNTPFVTGELVNLHPCKSVISNQT